MIDPVIVMLQNILDKYNCRMCGRNDITKILVGSDTYEHIRNSELVRGDDVDRNNVLVTFMEIPIECMSQPNTDGVIVFLK